MAGSSEAGLNMNYKWSSKTAPMMDAGDAVSFPPLPGCMGGGGEEGKERVGKKRRVEGGKTSGRSEPSNATPEAKSRGRSENCC